MLDTSVASAHRYRARRLAGRATVTAAANRSQRPGPTGSPAWRSAAPKRALTSARSSATGAGTTRTGGAAGAVATIGIP